MKLTGLLGRIAVAVFVAVATFFVLYIVGILVGKADVEIGNFIKQYSAMLGVLAGIVMFLTGKSPIA